MSAGSRITLVIAALALLLAAPLGCYVLRADGPERLGWFGVPTCRPTGILIHHTGLPDTLDGHRVDVAFLADVHGRRGYGTLFRGRWYSVGYHYVILADGEVQRGRPEEVQGAHAGDLEGNRHLLGIAVAGNFDSSSNPAGLSGRTAPTARQLNALTHLLRELMARYHLPPTAIVGHSQWRAGTACPGDRLPIEPIRAALGSAGVR
jgi:hypothetical protein